MDGDEGEVEEGVVVKSERRREGRPMLKDESLLIISYQKATFLTETFKQRKFARVVAPDFSEKRELAHGPQ